jgi:hypothetical protein
MVERSLVRLVILGVVAHSMWVDVMSLHVFTVDYTTIHSMGIDTTIIFHTLFAIVPAKLRIGKLTR